MSPSPREKPGRRYEAFLYDTFRKLFPDFVVVQNDHIEGLESGIRREIDVSLRREIDDLKLLYVVQAKDHQRPADINIIGTFSAVIRDVKASKGFLICAAGFAKTIHRYAMAHGIELVTVEDIWSRRWKAKIEIPIISTIYDVAWEYDRELTISQELADVVAVRQQPVEVDKFLYSSNAEAEFVPVAEFVKRAANAAGLDLSKPSKITLPDGSVSVMILGVRLPVSDSTIRLSPVPRSYLKMVKPERFRVMRDHIRETSLPLNMRIRANILPDDTWQLIDAATLPVNPAVISYEFEFHPSSLGSTETTHQSITAI